MSFRRDSQRVWRWKRWMNTRSTLIAVAGLPADVVADQQAFEHLLNHNYNAAGWTGTAPWFHVSMLSVEQLVALRELVTAFVRDFWPSRNSEELALPLAWLWEMPYRRDV